MEDGTGLDTDVGEIAGVGEATAVVLSEGVRVAVSCVLAGVTDGLGDGAAESIVEGCVPVQPIVRRTSKTPAMVLLVFMSCPRMPSIAFVLA